MLVVEISMRQTYFVLKCLFSLSHRVFHFVYVCVCRSACLLWCALRIIFTCRFFSETYTVLVMHPSISATAFCCLYIWIFFKIRCHTFYSTVCRFILLSISSSVSFYLIFSYFFFVSFSLVHFILSNLLLCKLLWILKIQCSNK